MNEKVYKTMTKTGGFSIAMGIVSVVVGLVVSGALLLKRKSELTF